MSATLNAKCCVNSYCETVSHLPHGPLTERNCFRTYLCEFKARKDGKLIVKFDGRWYLRRFDKRNPNIYTSYILVGGLRFSVRDVD